MVACPRCLHRNPDGRFVCEACGTPLQPKVENPWRANPWSPVPPVPPVEPVPNTVARGPYAPHPPAFATGVPAGEAELPVDTNWARARATGGPAPQVRVRLCLSSGQTFELAGRSSFVVGRRDVYGTPPDVDLSEWDGAASGVSRRHVLVSIIGPVAYVEDLHSRNETIRNGMRLLPGRRYALADGDRLRLGMLEVLVILG